MTLIARIRPLSTLRAIAFVLIFLAALSIAHAQGAKLTVPENEVSDSDADHVKERNEWFFRGRVVHGKPTAELRRRAYQAKLRMRAQHRAALAMSGVSQGISLSSGSWIPLGPMPLAKEVPEQIQKATPVKPRASERREALQRMIEETKVKIQGLKINDRSRKAIENVVTSMESLLILK